MVVGRVSLNLHSKFPFRQPLTSVAYLIFKGCIAVEKVKNRNHKRCQRTLQLTYGRDCIEEISWMYFRSSVWTVRKRERERHTCVSSTWHCYDASCTWLCYDTFCKKTLCPWKKQHLGLQNFSLLINTDIMSMYAYAFVQTSALKRCEIQKTHAIFGTFSTCGPLESWQITMKYVRKVCLWFNVFIV